MAKPFRIHVQRTDGTIGLFPLTIEDGPYDVVTTPASAGVEAVVDSDGYTLSFTLDRTKDSVHLPPNSACPDGETVTVRNSVRGTQPGQWKPRGG